MEDNPYESPESEAEDKAPQRKPPSPQMLALFNGYMAWQGVFTSQIAVVITFNREVAPTLAERQLMLLVYTLIGLPIGAGLAWWTLRSPKSKWPLSVALCLAAIGFLLMLIPAMLYKFN